MVVGIDDNSTRKKLLQSSKLTLGQFIDIFRSTETSARQHRQVMTQDDVFEKFPTLLPLFWTSKFQLKATVYALVFTPNLQTPTVTCCIHLRIHYTSRILFLSRSFSDSNFSDKSEAMWQFVIKRGFETEKEVII